eukprot:TRINITY_DN31481_c0_g1_i1.p1 TRINITY_DN31481_c0_g1~~TRINITY_DN31481_c0_g1_i1.p1  ORF type:complete len:852 (-),score=144.61 TRINITY_DN31481_c0_g1_i1:154-2709(-)
MDFPNMTTTPTTTSLIAIGSAGSTTSTCTFIGMMLPLVPNEHEWGNPIRAVIYLIFLLWLFKGVGIASDIFMEAIETITSSRKRKFNPETGRWLTVMVWNPTVANLSLMALGSSAPEILLSVLETALMRQMFSGELGPSTIVGSAAFNLFVIIAVCIYAIDDGQVRYIKETRVYMVTAASSIFAYLWILIVLTAISPNVVEVWEGVVTLLFFPILLFIAFAADAGYFGGQQGPKAGRGSLMEAGMSEEDLKELEEDIINRHGSSAKLSREVLAEIMAIEAKAPTSMAKYRKKRLAKKPKEPDDNNKIKPPTCDPAKIMPLDDDEDETHGDKEECHYFSFQTSVLAVQEDVGKVELIVTREAVGTGLDKPATVQYKSRDGTAKSPDDYTPVEGILCFEAGETEKQIFVTIIDDEGAEETEEFYVDLFSPEVANDPKVKCAIGSVPYMTVMIIDNDLPGTLVFQDESLHVQGFADQETKFDIIVNRKDGCTGQVTVKYSTQGVSALSNIDFDPFEGTLEFENGECSKSLPGVVKAKKRYHAESMFRVILEELSPEGAKFDSSTDGGADACICTVIIKTDKVERDPIMRVKSAMFSSVASSSAANMAWRDQFKDALFNVYGDEDEDEDVQLTAYDKCSAYFGHFILMPFNIVCACIPPTKYCGGKLCFAAALIVIGIVTAIIGDVAALFGCCLGIKDSVTAITFVALGTSLPDTFASMKAAKEEEYADASVGNVTGSNSVNVFLGLGMPWTLASIYWTAVGPNDKWREDYAEDSEVPEAFRNGAYIVKAGNLGFSVGVFCVSALVAIVFLYVRRIRYGGELGGPRTPKIASAIFLVCLWGIYILMSVLQTEGII